LPADCRRVGRVEVELGHSLRMAISGFPFLGGTPTYDSQARNARPGSSVGRNGTVWRELTETVSDHDRSLGGVLG
jgi:hypothetical protein